MKKTLLLILATGVAMASSSAFAAQTTTPSWDPSLTQAKSCKEVEAVFKEYFTSNWNGGYFGPVRGGVMMNDAATKSAVAPEAGGM